MVENFNEYEIKGDIAILNLITRENKIYKCIIDKEDLEKIDFIRWHIRYTHNNTVYACATKYVGKINNKYKYDIIHMHSLIKDVFKKERNYC